MSDYLNSGTSGAFANLYAKNAFEIPMQVFLPSGCQRIRSTISGTDVDGIREVNGKIAVYEAKNQDAKFSKGQVSALFSLLKRKGVDFVILSRWSFFDLPDDTQNQQVMNLKTNGYTKFAIPLKAAVFCRSDETAWLESYLTCKIGVFDYSIYDRNEMIHRYVVKFPDCAKEDYLMLPTPEWSHIAWMIDAYAEVFA